MPKDLISNLFFDTCSRLRTKKVTVLLFANLEGISLQASAVWLFDVVQPIFPSQGMWRFILPCYIQLLQKFALVWHFDRDVEVSVRIYQLKP
jgi:hypothetical protein